MCKNKKDGRAMKNLEHLIYSGIFETMIGVYTDINQVNTSVLETTWSLIDPINLILKLESVKELTAN